MKSIGTEFLSPDCLSGVNHMRGMSYHTVLNIAFYPELVQICVHNCYT